MSGKKKGKQSRGYVRGDAYGNFIRAFWTVSKFDACNLPRQISRDPLRQFVILQCFDYPMTVQSRFYTCAELVKLAWQASIWSQPVGKKNKNGTDPIMSAKRQMRKVCRELGIEIKPAPVGRPRSKQ